MPNDNKPAGPRPRSGVRLDMGEAPADAAPAPTPSQQVLARASKTVEVTDETGRRFTLKRPSQLAVFRFVEALGQLASNDRYFAMALPLLFVVAIDGEPEEPPARKSELEALIKQLGEEGCEAIAKGVEKNFDRGNADREEVKD